LKRLRIEALHRFFRRRAIRELDEREPAWSAGLAIDRHHHLRRFGDG
jgi:hypothetical protein